MYDNSSSAVGALIFLFFTGIGLLISLAVWILNGFAFFKMASKANVSNPWLAFIPIGNFWPYLHTIKKSAWNILWLLIPIVGEVFAIIWMTKHFKAFNKSPHWTWMLIGSFIPFLNFFFGIFFLVMYCYMGFSKNAQYNPHFDYKATPTGPGFTA